MEQLNTSNSKITKNIFQTGNEVQVNTLQKTWLAMIASIENNNYQNVGTINDKPNEMCYSEI